MKYIHHSHRLHGIDHMMWGRRIFFTPLERPSELPTPNLLSSAISRIASIFPIDPQITALLEKEQARLSTLDKESLKKMSSYKEWVTAIGNLTPEHFTNTYQAPPREPNEIFGPLELLKSLPLAQRQSVYLKFIDKYIPAKIQEEQGWIGRTAEERIVSMGASGMQLAAGAIQGMLGMDESLGDRLDDQSKVDLARASLRDYYKMDHPDFKDHANPDRLNRIPWKLEEDYEHALEYEKLRGNQDVATDPKNIEEEIQYSPFKGALQLGVVDKEILTELYPIVVGEKDFETTRAVAGAGRKLNELTGAVEAMVSQEAETVKERWDNLHPGIKLLVLGGLTFGMLKSRAMRIGGGVLGAIYLYQKLIVGEKQPIEKWGELISTPFDYLTKRNQKDVGQSLTPGTVADVMGHANLYVKFIKKFDYVNMEDQAVGLGILNDMSLSTLATNFEMGGKDDEQFYLNVEGMDPLLKKAMKQRGWNNDYRKFYADAENRRQSAEAMGWVFYLYAAQDLQNADEVEFIEETRRDLEPGSSISRLPSPWESEDPMKNQRYVSSDPNFEQRMKDSEQLYVRMVAKGREMALADDRPLGEFALSQMRLPPPLSRNHGGEPDTKSEVGSVPATVPDVKGDTPPATKTAPGGIPNSANVPIGEIPEEKNNVGETPSRAKEPEGGTPKEQRDDGGIPKPADSPPSGTPEEKASKGDIPSAASNPKGGIPSGVDIPSGDAPATRNKNTGGTPQGADVVNEDKPDTKDKPGGAPEERK